MRIFIHIVVLLLIWIPSKANDSNQLDSLAKALHQAKHDTTRIKIHLQVIMELYAKNPDTLLPLSKKMIALVDQCLPKLSKKQQHYFLALKANAYNNLGAYFNQKGDIRTSLSYFKKSLRLKEQLNEKAAIAKTLNNIGYIYEVTGELDDALLYYKKSLYLKEQLKDSIGIATTLINLGSIYDTRNDTALAIEYYNQSLAIFNQNKNEKGIANILNNIAFLRSSRGNNNGVEQLYLHSMMLREKIGDVQGNAESHVNLGYFYFNQKQFTKALIHAEKAYQIALEIGFPEYIKRSAELLKDLYIQNGNYQKAVEMYDLFIRMKDSLVNENNRNEAIKNKYQYDYEKKRAQDSIRNVEHSRVERLKSQTEIKQQQNYIIAGSIVLVLLLLIAVLLYRAVKLKTRSELLITQQKNIIESQKELVEEKQKEIVDSINYAKRIQTSFLASEIELKRHLKDYFLLYKPKDIVSGDFYWCEKVGTRTFIAICDCTGHGIPGAFMSLLNISLLNEAVLSKGLTKPNEILDFVRKIVIMGLNKGSETKGQDGMDAILFCLDSNEPNKIIYAAANNAPCIIRQNELTELKYDKMPVGKSPMDNIPFTLFEAIISSGDTLIAYTDGYADQFGGPKGKKFKYTKLNQTLVEINQLSMTQQSKRLEEIFDQWICYPSENSHKSNFTQLDDVCIFGLKMS